MNCLLAVAKLNLNMSMNLRFLIHFYNAVVPSVKQSKSSFVTFNLVYVVGFNSPLIVLIITFFPMWLVLSYCSADAIERAWQIVEQIPGRATGAYSHSQVFD